MSTRSQDTVALLAAFVKGLVSAESLHRELLCATTFCCTSCQTPEDDVLVARVAAMTLNQVAECEPLLRHLMDFVRGGIRHSCVRVFGEWDADNEMLVAGTSLPCIMTLPSVVESRSMIEESIHFCGDILRGLSKSVDGLALLRAIPLNPFAVITSNFHATSVVRNGLTGLLARIIAELLSCSTSLSPLMLQMASDCGCVHQLENVIQGALLVEMGDICTFEGVAKSDWSSVIIELLSWEDHGGHIQPHCRRVVQQMLRRLVAVHDHDQLSAWLDREHWPVSEASFSTCPLRLMIALSDALHLLPDGPQIHVKCAISFFWAVVLHMRCCAISSMGLFEADILLKPLLSASDGISVNPLGSFLCLQLQISILRVLAQATTEKMAVGGARFATHVVCTLELLPSPLAVALAKHIREMLVGASTREFAVALVDGGILQTLSKMLVSGGTESLTTHMIYLSIMTDLLSASPSFHDAVVNDHAVVNCLIAALVELGGAASSLTVTAPRQWTIVNVLCSIRSKQPIEAATMIAGRLFENLASLEGSDEAILLRQCWVIQSIMRVCQCVPGCKLGLHVHMGVLLRVLKSTSIALAQAVSNFGSDALHLEHDVLFLGMSLVAEMHLSMSSGEIDALCSQLFTAMSYGPFASCLHFTAIVTRLLTGMALCSTQVAVENISEWAPRRNFDFCCILLERLGARWVVVEQAGDTLFRSGAHCVARRQFIGVVHELISAALGRQGETAQMERVLHQCFAVADFTLYFAGSGRYGNLVSLLECAGPNKGIISQLGVALATIVPHDRKHGIAAALQTMRALGLMTCHSASVVAAMALAVVSEPSGDGEHTSETISIDLESAEQLFSTMSAVLANSSRVVQPRSFIELPMGIDIITKLSTAQSAFVVPDHSVVRGGVFVPTQFEVDREAVISIAVWCRLDSVHECVLVSLVLDDNRGAIALEVADDGQLRITGIVNTKAGSREKSVSLDPQLQAPLQRWTLVTIAISRETARKRAVAPQLAFTSKVSLFWIDAAGSFQFASSSADVEHPSSLLGQAGVTRFTTISSITLAGYNASSASGASDSLNGRRGRLNQSLMLGAVTAFSRELSEVEELLLFSIGSDGMISSDFSRRECVLDNTSHLVRYAGSRHAGVVPLHVQTIVGVTLALAEHELVESVTFSTSTPPPGWPFADGDASVLCVIGSVDGRLNELCFLSRITGDGEGTSSPQRTIGGDAIAELTWGDVHTVADAPTNTSSVIFCSAPASKPLLCNVLTVTADDFGEDATDGDIGRTRALPSFCQVKPTVHNLSPLWCNIEGFGGVPHVLSLVSLLPGDSQAQRLGVECAGTILERHVVRLLDHRTVEGAKSLSSRIFVSAMLHSRISIREEIAKIFCDVCVSENIIVRPDVIPILLDFSLWARSDAALVLVCERISSLIASSASPHFNKRLLDRFQALDGFLLHLHMHFSGNTQVRWDTRLIPPGRKLLVALCTDSSSMWRIVASASWLSSEPSPRAAAWAAGLLSAILEAVQVHNSLRSIKTDNPSVVGNLLSILQSPSDEVRLCALKVFLNVVNLHRTTIVVKLVNAYQRRSLEASTTITNAELCEVCAMLVGTANVNEELTLLAQSVLDFGPSSASLSPALFCVATLIPHVSQQQRTALISFLHKAFLRSSRAQQLAMLTRSLTDGPDDSLVSTLFYSLAAIVENRHFTPQTDLAVCCALVELVVELCARSIDFAAQAKQQTAVNLFFTSAYELYSLFTTEEDVRNRVSSPFFNIGRRFVLTLCTACLAQFDSCLTKDKSCTPPFVNQFVMFLETLNELFVLLMLPESHDEIDEDEELLNRAMQHRSVGYPVCEYMRRNKAGNKPLKVARVAMEAPDRSLSVAHLNSDNLEMLPLYALQVGTRVCFKLELLGTRHLVVEQRKLVMQQTKLIRYISSVSGSPSVMQMLTQIHFLDLSRSDFVKGDAPSISGVMRADELPVVPSLVRDREAAVILLQLAVREITLGVEERRGLLLSLGARTLSMVLSRGSAGARAHLSHQFLHLHDDVLSSIDTSQLLSDTNRERLIGELQVPADHIFSASGLSLLQTFSNRTIAAAQDRALNTTRNGGSFVAALDPHEAMAHDQGDAEQQRFITTIFTGASKYRKYLEDDGNALLAANASYRFSLLPWWGELASLYTESSVPYDCWELDSFMGPEWERIKLRRYLRAQSINVGTLPALSASLKHLRASAPLLQNCLAMVDDVELMESHGITGQPQIIGDKVANADATPFTCQLILPMDRVPIRLYVADRSLSIVVEWHRYQHHISVPCHVSPSELKHGEAAFSSTPPPTSTTIDDADGVDSLPETPHRMATCTPAKEIAAVPTSFKYRHEVPATRRAIELERVRAVWKRRNQLRHVAIEIVAEGGESVLFAFDTEDEMEAVHELLNKRCKPFLDRTMTSSDGTRKMWRQWWCDGRISNFKYLMFLNFMAGRSYSDLRQYPVFPQVIADFCSAELDLSSSSVFRNLERPMGAQTDERAERARQYYEGFDTHESESFDGIPRHYGSHYLPPGAVLHYLVRLQPFTDYFLDMNKKLDEPDRVFDAVQRAWMVSTTTKEVRELIPEYYCNPHFLVNSANIPFGIKQDGTVVNDVALPRWSQTPREFVAIARQALECRKVSENLNSWIDLIFGCKQSGPAAVEALNVFHPLTYEGTNVHLIDDAVQRTGYLSQIDHFGQVPMKLFKAPHKQRISPSNNAPLLTNPCPTLRFDSSMAKQSILLNIMKCMPAPNTVSRDPATIGSLLFCRSKAGNAAMGADESTTFLITSTTSRNAMIYAPNEHPFNIVNDIAKDVVLMGLNGGHVQLLDAASRRPVASLSLKGASVATTIAAEAPLLFIGTMSGAILVYQLSELPVVEVVAGGLSDAPTTVLLEATKRVQYAFVAQCTLYGHVAPVTRLIASTEWGLLVSSAIDGQVAVWDIGRRILTRVLHLEPLAPMSSTPVQVSQGCLRHRLCRIQTVHATSISVNPKSGDIFVGVIDKRDPLRIRRFLHLSTVNGETVRRLEWSGVLGSLLAVGPYAFVGEDKEVAVLSASSLSPVAILRHPDLADVVFRLALNPHGTMLTVADRAGQVVSWKVSNSGGSAMPPRHLSLQPTSPSQTT